MASPRAPIAGLVPPSADDLVAIGQAILARLSPELGVSLERVPIIVADWPSDELLDEMGVEDPLDLTGVFEGPTIADQEGSAPPPEPATVHLFRLPILLEWCERGEALEEVVFDVLTHELGHYMGLSEDEVLRLEGRAPE